MEICTQVNLISLNTNLSYHNATDTATSIMLKKFETGIINYVPCISFKLNLLSCLKAPERQVTTLKIMKSLHDGRQCDHKTLKRVIPDLYYVP